METHSRKKKNDAKMSEIARHWNLQRVTENKSVLLRGRGGGGSHTQRVIGRHVKNATKENKLRSNEPWKILAVNSKACCQTRNIYVTITN